MLRQLLCVDLHARRLKNNNNAASGVCVSEWLCCYDAGGEGLLHPASLPRAALCVFVCVCWPCLNQGGRQSIDQY